jgi:hypothetical protein
MIIGRGNCNTVKETSPNATLPTTNPMKTIMELNLGLHGVKLVTDHLRYGIVLCIGITV